MSSFLEAANRPRSTPAPPAIQPKQTTGGTTPMTTKTDPVPSNGGSASLPFTVYDMDDFDLTETNYKGEIQHVTHVSDVGYLLQYVSKVEEQTHLTLPLEAYGFSRELFDSLNPIRIGDDTYELVDCGGKPYLSCCTKVLDKGYFDEITRNAALSLVEWGKYEMPLIVPRLFTDFDGVEKIFTTIALNTYENNLLMKYMREYGADVFSVNDSNGGVKLVFRKK